MVYFRLLGRLAATIAEHVDIEPDANAKQPDDIDSETVPAGGEIDVPTDVSSDAEIREGND